MEEVDDAIYEFRRETRMWVWCVGHRHGEVLKVELEGWMQLLSDSVRTLVSLFIGSV